MPLAAPLVAVVIPCHRQAQFLAEAVESVVAQLETRWELVIVDDGSPDATALVAQALIVRYPEQNIRLVRQPNAGLGAARNAGFRATKAPLLLALDADDALEPAFLARCLPLFESDPAVGFVYSDAQFFGVDTRRYRPGAFDPRRLAFNNPLLPHTLLRRALWEQAGGYAARGVVPGVEDWDLWLSALEAGWEGRYVPETLVRYRRREASMLASVHSQDLLLRARLILRHQCLFPRPLVVWAARAALPPVTQAEWLRRYTGYLALIARYYPRYLPKAMLRPFYARLGARRQGQWRRLGAPFLS